MQFESSNASGESDEAFIQLLAHAAAAANSGRDAGSDAGSSPAGQQGGKAGSKRKGARGGAGKGSSGRGSAGTGAAAVAGGLGAADLVRLQLAEDDVAKVRLCVWLCGRGMSLFAWETAAVRARKPAPMSVPAPPIAPVAECNR